MSSRKGSMDVSRSHIVLESAGKVVQHVRPEEQDQD